MVSSVMCHSTPETLSKPSIPRTGVMPAVPGLLFRSHPVAGMMRGDASLKQNISCRCGMLATKSPCKLGISLPVCTFPSPVWIKVWSRRESRQSWQCLPQPGQGQLTLWDCGQGERRERIVPTFLLSPDPSRPRSPTLKPP